jgi:hypothetical protein
LVFLYLLPVNLTHFVVIEKHVHGSTVYGYIVAFWLRGLGRLESDLFGRRVGSKMKRDTVYPELDSFAHVHDTDPSSIQHDLFGHVPHFEDSFCVDVNVFGSCVTQDLMVVVIYFDKLPNVGLDAVGTAIYDNETVVLVFVLIARSDWRQIGVCHRVLTKGLMMAEMLIAFLMVHLFFVLVQVNVVGRLLGRFGTFLDAGVAWRLKI